MSDVAKSHEDLASWDAAAPLYSDAVRSAPPRFADFLEQAVGDPSGLDILDVGCGHGWYSDTLAKRGAHAVGVDGSAQLLAIARREYPAAQYVSADLTQGLPADVISRRFDRVVALMVLMDPPNLDPLLRDIAKCLRAAGRLVITLTHPAFFYHSPVEDPATGECYRRVTGYLEAQERWIESFGGHRHYHRPLSWYVNLLSAHGFAITQFVEPPTPAPGDRSAEYDHWFSTIPTMLGLVAQPMPRPS